jgi:hypothetical protein
VLDESSVRCGIIGGYVATRVSETGRGSPLSTPLTQRGGGAAESTDEQDMDECLRTLPSASQVPHPWRLACTR